MNYYPTEVLPYVQAGWDGISDFIVQHAAVLSTVLDAIGPIYQY